MVAAVAGVAFPGRGCVRRQGRRSAAPGVPAAHDLDFSSRPSSKDCPNAGGAGSLGSGTLGVLLGLPPNAAGASQETLNLPVSLAMTTLLTGPAFSCAGAYTVENPGSAFPYLGVCGAPAAQPLRTSRGHFYLQDQIGGSTNDPMPADFPSQIYYGWDLANYGSLQVEVQAHERE
jgi:hypothetical protein